nr:hypothetical protein [archaeon]
KPYSQIPIKFLCNTKIKEKQNGWRVTLCPEYDKNQANQRVNFREKLAIPDHYQSIAAVKFEECFINKLAIKDVEEDFCKPVTILMEVQAVLPDITLDKTSLNFWECNLKEKKVISITITNKNEYLPVDFSFNKIPHFTVEPNKGIIKAGVANINSQMTVQVYFHPENIGKFSDVLIMKYVNNMYEIPIRIYGTCTGKTNIPKNMTCYNEKGFLPSITQKGYKPCKTVYGNGLCNAQYVPDELALDFTSPKRKRIDQNAKIQKLHQHRLDEVIAKVKGSDKRAETQIDFSPSNEHIKNFEENFKVYNQIFNHKAKANAELTKMRLDRQKRKLHHLNTETDDLLNLKGNRLDSPRLTLPQPSDPLWVVKPVGNYEPVYLEETAMKDFVRSQDELPDTTDSSLRGNAKTSEVPRTHQEMRECKLELKGEELQKIQVSPKELKMGQIFLKSEKGGTFWVKNNHKNHIYVKLEIDSSMPDLMRTTPKSHVIAPGEIQGFRVMVYSTQIRNAVYPVKYTINYKHTFKLKVSADIIKVKLELPDHLNRFQFKNDKGTDKDGKIEMYVKQKLKIFNNGNAKAIIKWSENKETAFSVSPQEMEIKAGKEEEATVIFNPFEASTPGYKFTDELTLNIENGDSKKYLVEGIVQPCVVKFFNLENDTVDFGMIHTGIENIKKFHIKNETPRTTTAYQIINNYPEFLDFKDMCGYLTDKAKEIEIILKHKEAKKDFEVTVPILIRGSSQLTLRIIANIVQPQVSIVEQSFDFGGVGLNESTTKKLTFKNDSKLQAKVNINLNSENIYRDFKLILPEEEKQKRPNCIIPLEKENKDDFNEEEEENKEEEENEEEEEEEDKLTED